MCVCVCVCVCVWCTHSQCSLTVYNYDTYLVKQLQMTHE